MTLNQLKYFIEITKIGNFTAAANNLYIAQPTLSYSISQLENELRHPLFIRHPNKQISLTPYGENFLAYAEAAVNNIEKGIQNMEYLDDKISGTVKIITFWSISLTDLPQLMVAFNEAAKADNNDINIDFEVEHHWSNFQDLLEKGLYDFSISSDPLSSNCSYMPVSRQRIIAMVPASHRLAQKEAISPADLNGETLICFDPKSHIDTYIKNFLFYDNVSCNLRYVKDWTSQRLAISMGEGVGITIDSPIDAPPGVKKLSLDAPPSLPAFLPIYLSWHKSRELTPSANFVKRYFSNLDIYQ